MAAPWPAAPCGTRSAYKRHKRRGEPVDQPCRDAMADWTREYRARKAAQEPTVPNQRAAPHGTSAGYERCLVEVHRGLRDRTCQPCRDAQAAKSRRVAAAVGVIKRFQPTPMPDGVAACTAPDVNPEWFFSVDQNDAPHMTKGQRASRNTVYRRRALKVCGVCTIREQCLAQNGDMAHGIIGGITDFQRRHLSEPHSFFDQHVGLVAANGEGVNHVS